LVQNAPTDSIDSDSPVAKIGRLLGGWLSHGALYGDMFSVKSVSDAHNIAYTSVPLGPHQDLAYYESKPGLQLLHCISNEGIEGGESVLLDAMAAAEELRRISPEHFDTLTKCPATFVKQREGADMIYRRPHIVLDDSADIVSVNWSPPFEGPLSVSPQLVEAYYNAYRAFELMVDNSLPEEHYSDDSDPELVQILRNYAQEYTWQRRLETGEILIFNNVRMLHGRRGFEFSGDSGGRHLLGCYTNIDDTLNRYRVLLRERSGGALVRNVGNGTCGMP
jgi:gamma-butyrobetaine dioxygenase